MSFIAKAYIKIQRNTSQDLILALSELKYAPSAYHPSDIFWFIEDGYFYSREYTTELEERFVDCNAYTPNGTEEEATKLFLELAMMRGDAEENQLFRCVRSVPPYYHYGDIVRRESIDVIENFKRAEPLDVAAEFKQGGIVL